MKLTWLGTAATLPEAEGRSFLFDPFVQLPGGEHPNTPEIRVIQPEFGKPFLL